MSNLNVSIKPFDYILLKLASRCNINCDYCYWFKDPSVYKSEAILTPQTEDDLIKCLDEHLYEYSLSKFSILLHGGEPLLFGKERFDNLCTKLYHIMIKRECTLKLSLTTNGLLIDEEWVELFKKYKVSITVSIDGPPAIHDSRRKDFKNRNTSHLAIQGFKLLKEANINSGVLAVCSPQTNPKDYTSFFISELGLKSFDILVPDATHEDTPLSITNFYTNLFDLWISTYLVEGVKIRFIESIVKGLLGFQSRSESIGYGTTETVTVLTDGSLEPLDVMRITGEGATKTRLNVSTHRLQDLADDPLWKEIRYASLNLPKVCNECKFKQACGGGHISSRWSNSNRLNNPSIYCNDFKNIMSHMWKEVQPTLYYK